MNKQKLNRVIIKRNWMGKITEGNYPLNSRIDTKSYYHTIIPSRGNGGRLARRDGFSLTREKVGCYHHSNSNLQTNAKKQDNLLHEQKPPARIKDGYRMFPPLPLCIIHLYCQTLLVTVKFGGRIVLSISEDRQIWVKLKNLASILTLQQLLWNLPFYRLLCFSCLVNYGDLLCGKAHSLKIFGVLYLWI